VTSVAISIVSTDEFPKVEACLRSIAAQEFDGELFVTVVCNGQPDDTSRIHLIYPSATTIVNGVRLGFAENHNAALASRTAEFGLLLNPDVELASTCVSELVGAMRIHKQAGVVGPLLRYPDGVAQLSARRFPRIAGTLVRRTPLRRVIDARLGGPRHYLPPPTVDRAVDWLLGACLLVRSTAWADIGGFDPGYRPLYVEDIDLAWRMWRAGWEVWQTASAEAIHEHQAATDKRFFDRRTLWHAHGMLRFVRKHPRFLLGKSPRRTAT